MKVRFKHAEAGREHTVKESIGDYYILDVHPSYWSTACYVAVPKIEVDVISETVYRIGQRFRLGDDCDEYLLAYVSSNHVNLVNIKHGTRWAEPIYVNDPLGITAQQLTQLSRKWTLIS